MILNDLERRNGRYYALFHRIWEVTGALRKVVEDNFLYLNFLRQKCSPKHL